MAKIRILKNSSYSQRWTGRRTGLSIEEKEDAHKRILEAAQKDNGEIPEATLKILEQRVADRKLREDHSISWEDFLLRIENAQ